MGAMTVPQPPSTHSPQTTAPAEPANTPAPTKTPPTSSSPNNTTTDNKNQVLSECQEGAFEGPEKLLEIWFHPSENMASRQQQNHLARASPDSASDEEIESYVNSKPCTANGKGLRSVPKNVWKDMLTIVRCQVLSTIHNDHIDAFLLSESSMFVYSNKLVLKTCGTTTLLVALPRILEIARDYCGFHRVWRVFYSRKSFMFPELQRHPHKTWKDEVNFLDNLFDNGSAYVVGKVNGDHWNLYLTAPAKNVLHQDVSSIASSSSEDSENSDSDAETADAHVEDENIEILMTELCPIAMRNFHHKADEPDGLEGGRRVERDTHLDYVYPSATTDSFLFTPCGYSMNGLKDDKYFTVHVTPEPSCSYASYETTVRLKSLPGKKDTTIPLTRLVSQVVDVFRPKKFSVTVFNSVPHSAPASKSMGEIPGFKRTDRIHYEFDGYDMVFGHFEKIE